MFKNVASQKIALFAFDITTGAPKTGDSANITPYVSKDYGTVTILGTTTATEMDSTNAKGWYSFVLAQAETNGDALLFTAKSSTANISLVGRLVFTDAPNANLLSVDSNGRVDVIKVNGTSQTARDLGASVLLSAGTGTGQLDFTSGVVKTNLTQVNAHSVTDTASGVLDVNAKNIGGTAQTGRDIGASVLLAAGQKVDVDTIKTNPVVNGGTITFPTNATVASTTNITAGTITTVTNLTNAPTAGDLTATMKTSVTTAATAATPTAAAVTGAVGSVTGLTASDVGAIKTQTDKLAFTVTNQVDANVLDWKSSTAPAMTGDAYARLGAPAGASVSADVAAVKTDTAAVKTKTDSLTFTVPNKVDANVKSVNDVTVTGVGTAGSPWGP